VAVKPYGLLVRTLLLPSTALAWEYVGGHQGVVAVDGGIAVAYYLTGPGRLRRCHPRPRRDQLGMRQARDDVRKAQAAGRLRHPRPWGNDLRAPAADAPAVTPMTSARGSVISCSA